jgi:DNA repair protein RecO
LSEAKLLGPPIGGILPSDQSELSPQERKRVSFKKAFIKKRMEETFNTKAIILNRYDFRETDSRIICFSPERGKMELVARGAKKLKSKLSGHIEPLTLARIMVVRGRDINYVGTAAGEIFFSNIKDDLEKIKTALAAAALVEKMTRENETDGLAKVFCLLKDFLEDLDCGKLVNNDDFSQQLSNVLGFSREEFAELQG